MFGAFVLFGCCQTRSCKLAKPQFVNNNYIKSSSVAFDYAKCSDKLPDVFYDKEKRGQVFLRILISSKPQANIHLW